MRLFATLAMGALVAACGKSTGRDFDLEASSRAEAREITEIARQVAVAKPGAAVCRQLTIGISEREWIRGIVSEVAKGRIRIRIDDPGRFQHFLDGAPLARGAYIWDAVLDWTPCS